LLDAPPATEREQLLMAALEERNNRISLQKRVIVGQQAQTILHAAYVEDLREQLHGKEEKKDQQKDRGRINMDGRAKILTQDKIFEGVVE
ncbi:hypothetical protein B0H34DRAFT_632349, partial [Crassisporium funariophilum]